LPHARPLLLLTALSALFACSSPAGEVATDTSEAIVGGQRASAYQEAALIDAGSFICSGAILAPRVVLTAGHCVFGASSWKVTAPYAGRQTARARKRWTPYVDGGDSVNPNANDVAVLVLDRPIQLASYPILARSPVQAGTRAVNVGRIRDGRASSTDLYVGRPLVLRPGAAEGWRFAYVSDEVIEEGDSGGPVYTAAGGARALVAVNSGAGGGTQLLARVDLAYDDIQRVIAESGGPGGGAAADDAGASPPTACWSPTLGRDVAEGGCVQSSSNEVWFQCHDGDWYRGGDADSGPYGACTSSDPL
jgi:hypothetical protein